MSLIKLIRRELEKMLPMNMQCEVISVDTETGTCEVQPLLGGPALLDVRLNAGNGMDTGITPVPRKGSIVTVARLNETAAYVALCSDIEEYIVICDKLRFNDGKKGGLVDWPKLKEQLDKDSKLLKAFLDAYKNAAPVPSDGGAAIQTAVKIAIIPYQEANYSGLESEKIIHG